MSGPLKVAVLGATGRMGHALIRLIAADPGRWRLSGAAGSRTSTRQGQDAGVQAGLEALGVSIDDRMDRAVDGADVAVDFTLPAATPEVLDACAGAGVPLVSGTTGLDDATRARLEELSRVLAVVYARNFSPGVTLLTELARQAAEALDEDYDAEIVEAHHRRKLDAPSGTALALGEAVASGRGIGLESHAVWTRHGQHAPRERGQIGFAVLRAGGIVGDHTVVLASDEERLELTHRAADRSVFARGALRAALWLAHQAPASGLYDMRHVLGLARE